MERQDLLQVNHLSVSFDTLQGEVQAVRDVSFAVSPGEVLAIVGESGCGKSTLCKAIMKLLPEGARIKEGSIEVDGTDITDYSEKKMQKLRGSMFSMIFQDPMQALNPTMTIGAQIAEAILVHEPRMQRHELQERVWELMELVGIDCAKERALQHPYHFSGGMCQRIVLAIALASNPKLLFADEPTAALDVTVQAQILDLFKDVPSRQKTGIVFVSHDLGVVARVADRVAVMYAGRIVELGTAEDIFYRPRHPYTWGLIRSLPAFSRGRSKLYAIPGMPPDPAHLPKGDAFACRNEYALDIDYEKEPPMFALSDTHCVMSWLADVRAPKIDPPPGVGSESRIDPPPGVGSAPGIDPPPDVGRAADRDRTAENSGEEFHGSTSNELPQKPETDAQKSSGNRKHRHLLYYGKKVILFAVSVWILTVVVFYLSRLAPGDPLVSYYGDRVERMSDKEREWARERLGLNEPIHTQYVQWLKCAVRGDFGISYKYKRDVLLVIQGRIGNTMLLSGIGIVLIFVLALLLGVLCVWYENRWPDKLICRIGTAVSCIPEFWLSLVFILIFAVELKILPSSGAYTIGGGGLSDRLRHLILPLSVVVLGHLWYYAYMIRNRLLDEVRSDYVLLAKSKGLSRARILFGHCVRGTLPTYLSMIAISVPHIMGGTYIVETVFSYPGIGTLAYESARYKDYNLLMILCMLSGIIVILCSMLAQFINERIDPRIRASTLGRLSAKKRWRRSRDCDDGN